MSSSLGDDFHAGLISFADRVMDDFEAKLPEKTRQTLAAEIVLVLDLAPIWILASMIKRAPERRVHVRHRQEEEAVVPQ